MELFQSGKEEWNAWANSVLERRNDSDHWKTEARANFSSHKFGNADFSGFVFPGHVDFSGAQFMGNSWFIESYFKDTANFNTAIFDNEIGFIKTVFVNEARFENAIFNGDAQFGKSIFRSIVDFRNTIYRGLANFNNCSFSDVVLFIDATFIRYAMFNAIYCKGTDVYFKSHFKEGVTFENSVFAGNAHFRNSVFQDLSLFAHTHFGNDVSFDGFSGAVRFEHATFDGEAWFAKGVFNKVSRFDDTTFKKGARFEGCIFKCDVAFSASRFLSYATFDQAKFHGQVSFQAIESQSAFTMADAFFSDVPIFYQATFFAAPRLDNVQIRPANRQGIVRTAVWNLLKGDSNTSVRTTWHQLKAQGDAAAVRWQNLRRLASQGHDHQRELLFFREEVLSSRWVSDKPWQAYFWFGLLYQLFSDFGRSLSRPILWWLMWWTGFSLIYLFLRRDWDATEVSNTCSHPEIIEPWVAAVGMSLHQSLPALSGLGDRIGEFQKSLFGMGAGCLPLVPSSVSFLGVLQTVVATALLFLVLLATRNRFRIR